MTKKALLQYASYNTHMNIESIYTKLDSSDTEEDKGSALAHYLRERLKSLPESDAQRAEVAYEIAGLMSTKYAALLREDDVFEQIMTLAGELEVPDADNEQKWRMLQNLLLQLPDQERKL